eukprot:596029-Rhodomonas_salina.2
MPPVANADICYCNLSRHAMQGHAQCHVSESLTGWYILRDYSNCRNRRAADPPSTSTLVRPIHCHHDACSSLRTEPGCQCRHTLRHPHLFEKLYYERLAVQFPVVVHPLLVYPLHLAPPHRENSKSVHAGGNAPQQVTPALPRPAQGHHRTDEERPLQRDQNTRSHIPTAPSKQLLACDCGVQHASDVAAHAWLTVSPVVARPDRSTPLKRPPTITPPRNAVTAAPYDCGDPGTAMRHFRD